MEATIEGKELVIRIALEEPPYKATGSGSNLIAATTKGQAVTDLTIMGRPLTLSVVAYFPTS